MRFFGSLRTAPTPIPRLPGNVVVAVIVESESSHNLLDVGFLRQYNAGKSAAGWSGDFDADEPLGFAHILHIVSNDYFVSIGCQVQLISIANASFALGSLRVALLVEVLVQSCTYKARDVLQVPLPRNG